MKNRKMFLVAACVLAAAGVFASEGGLPASSADWPEKLGMTPKMLYLVLQIGIILFAAKLGGMLAGLLKLPSVLGELAAGIVIGPWALGGIPIPGFDGVFREGLFYGHALRAQATAGGNPFAVTPELYGICTVASVVLLFLSGIETNLKMFLKYAFAGSLVGIGGVVFSFAFGDLAAVYATTLFPGMLGNIKCLAHLGELVAAGETMKAILDPAAMFMGIMSTATSVGITARILSEKKKMDSEEGVTIMAGAVIDDVLGIIVLAIGMGIIASQQAAGAAAKGVEWGAIGRTAASAFGVWLGGTLLGVLLARRISWLLKLFKTPVAIATLAFGLSLIIAGAFEALGLTLIIGAYVMGLALSRTDIKHLVQDNLQSVYTFFVPIFFCVMGMMVDLSALCSKPVLVFGAIYTVLAVLAKVIGCAIPSLFCGFNVLGALRVGAGMIPRGEVALIIAGIGLSNGYLTQEVFGIGILMTLITTIISPPALVGLFATDRKGVRHPRPSMDGSRPVIFELPSTDVADLMVSKLVAAFRREGFFTTLLSSEGNIWEIAMDDIEVAISREGTQIKFICTPREEAIVMTVWMEVASELNDLARQIAKPIRRDDVEKMFRKTTFEGRGRKCAGRYLQGFVMLPKFRASSKREAIEKLVAEVAAAAPHHVPNVEEAIEAVLKREASMPTGLDHGIAVPHGRAPSVRGIAGAVAILDNEGTANGCVPDYETIDNSPLQIIVLTLANSEGQTPYLQLMSYLSRTLRTNNGYDRLKACKTPEAMRKFFRKPQLALAMLACAALLGCGDASQHEPEGADAFLDRAEERLAAGDLAAAKAAVNQAFALAGEDADVRLLSAQIAWHGKDYDRAEELFRKVAEDATLEPALRAEGWTGLGIVAMSRNAYEIAHLCFLHALRLDRRSAPARYHLAYLYRDGFGYIEAALDQFDAYVHLEPVATPRVQKVQKSVIPDLKKERERILTDRPGVSKRNSATAAALIAKGDAALKKGTAKDLKIACQRYQEALAADPISYPAALGLGQARLKADSSRAGLTKALESYQLACALKPSAVATFITAGDLALRLGRTTQAMEIFTRALAVNPTSVQALDGLIRAYGAQKDRASLAKAYRAYRTLVAKRK